MPTSEGVSLSPVSLMYKHKGPTGAGIQQAALRKWANNIWSCPSEVETIDLQL